jgi:hypothetical protein
LIKWKSLKTENRTLTVKVKFENWINKYWNNELNGEYGEGLIESNIESMNVRFEVRALVLKGIKLSLTDIACQPRTRNDGVLSIIDVVIWGRLKSFVVVVGKWGIRRREKTRRVEVDRWKFEDGTVAFFLRWSHRGWERRAVCAYHHEL